MIKFYLTTQDRIEQAFDTLDEALAQIEKDADPTWTLTAKDW